MRNDAERLREFRKLKEAIRTDPNYLIVGIDTAKLRHHACFLLSSGKIVARDFCFSNTWEGFEGLLGRIRKYCEETGFSKVICGLESTGNYQKPLADFLYKNGLMVVLVSTLAVSKNRFMLDVSWDKNDQKDALNIADLIAQGKFLFCTFSEERYLEASRLVRLYYRVAKERACLKIRLRNNILSTLFPEFERIFKRDISDPLAVRILQKYPHPALIQSVSEKDFISSVLIKRHMPSSKRRAYQVYRTAKNTIGALSGLNGVLVELNHLLQDLNELTRRKDKIKGLIYKQLKDFEPYKRLLTIPSVGPIIAATFLAEIGPIECYDYARQIIKLAGLDLAGVQSGSYKGQKHISKRGKVRLRAAAYQAALAAIRHEGPLREYYLKLVERKSGNPGAKMKALIALASKILRITFALLKNKTNYIRNYNYKDITHDHLKVTGIRHVYIEVR